MKSRSTLGFTRIRLQVNIGVSPNSPERQWMLSA
jgi:hypothetical protein